MAEQLKHSFNRETVKKFAAMIAAAYPEFNSENFIREASAGLDDLELLDRGRHVCKVLHGFLPAGFPQAADILIKSMTLPQINEDRLSGMDIFIYMPYGYYAEAYGIDDFEKAMALQYVLTQRFTAEFCIRPFIIRYPEDTMKKLHEWATDASPHVRRLVSEGTRPLLPWAMRLPLFRKNPLPVTELLEKLKDDPSEYVRRSVANNLNDIGKDNPAVLFEIARRWSKNADKNRLALIRHALRSAVKRAEPEALAILGVGKQGAAEAVNAVFTPARIPIGESAELTFDVIARTAEKTRLMIDLKIHYVKAGGKTSPKVFKLTEITVSPSEKITVRKRLSFKQMTTRRHYPGKHRAEAVINGQSFPLGEFELI